MAIIKTLVGFDRNRTVSFKQIYTDPLIQLKKYVDTFTNIGPAIDSHGRPVTGLTEDHTPPPVNGKIQKMVRGTRVEMEQELDLAEGTLKQNSVYWLAYKVRIGKDTIKYDLTHPEDLLDFLFLSAQTIVANGLSEVGTNSKIEYVIYSEEQEAADKVIQRRTLKKAYVLADSLDIETKVNLLAIHGFIVDASNTNTIENKIDEIVEADPGKFTREVNDTSLVYAALITKCLDKGILVMDDGAVLHGEVKVGYSKDVAAEALAKDNVLQAVLKAKLSGDMNLIQEALKAAKE